VRVRMHTYMSIIFGVLGNISRSNLFLLAWQQHTFVNGVDRRIIHFSSRNVNSRGWRKSTHPDRGEPGGSAERVVGKGDEWMVQT